ncbi:MAG: hypothetical protein ABIB97_03610 [Patescibacteria group bacterium]
MRKGLVFGLVIVTMLLALCLTGCSERLEYGDVVHKEIEPERTWVQILRIPQYHTQKIGEITITTTTYLTKPMLYHDDEDYVLIVEGTGSGGQRVQKMVYVSQSVYDSFLLGDRYTFTRESSTTDDIVCRDATEEEQQRYGVKETEESS